MGLSTTTCLPAWRAWEARSKWVSLGVATTMRSMLGSANASSRRAQDARGGVGLRGFVACALHDGGEFEAGDGGDERAVEDLAGKTIAEDSAVDGRFGHGVIVRRAA